MKVFVKFSVFILMLLFLFGSVFAQDTTLSILETAALGPDCESVGPTTSAGDGKIEKLKYDGNVIIKWISYEQWQGVTFDFANTPVDLKNYFATDTLYFRINVPAGFGDLPVALRNSSGWPNQVDYTITEADAAWDSTWREVKIPLDSMAAGGAFDSTAVNNLVMLAGTGNTVDKVAYIDYVQIGRNLSFPAIPSPVPPALPTEAAVSFRKLSLELFENGELGMDCNEVGPTVSGGEDKVYIMSCEETNLVKWVSYEQWQGVTFDLANPPVDLSDDFASDTLFFRINVPAGFGDLPVVLRNASGWPNQVDYTITEADAGWDGSWKTIAIPLDSMAAGGAFDSTAITSFVMLSGTGYTADKIAYIDYVKIGCNILIPLPDSDPPSLRKSLSLLENGEEGAQCDSVGPTVTGGESKVNVVDTTGSRLLEWVSYEQWQGVTFNLDNAPVDLSDGFATDTLFFRINVPAGFGDIPVAFRNESGWPNQVDYTITEADAAWDGGWKTLAIPLDMMVAGGAFDSTAITNFVMLAGSGYTSGKIAYLDYVKIGNSILYPVPPAPACENVSLSLFKDDDLGPDCESIGPTVSSGEGKVNIVDYRDDKVIEWISYEQWQGVTFDLADGPVDLSDNFRTDTLYLTVNIPTGFGDLPVALRNASGWPNQVDYTITEADAGWDGSWQTLAIPLDSMTAGGAFDSTAITNFVMLTGLGYTEGKIAYVSFVQIGNNSSTFIANEESLPEKFSLAQNYPNPFNPTTSIRYSLPKATKVKIVIYDIMGREICTLLNNNQTAGYKSIIWDGRDSDGHLVSSGIYLYHMVTDEFAEIKKMTFLK